MDPIWVLHAPPSSSHGTSTHGTQNSTSLQGLDFWVEPQGGHIADEDQDRVKQSNTKPRRKLREKSPLNSEKHIYMADFNFISLKLISKSAKKTIFKLLCCVFVSCFFVQ